MRLGCGEGWVGSVVDEAAGPMVKSGDESNRRRQGLSHVFLTEQVVWPL